jgi:hypothetical protein
MEGRLDTYPISNFMGMCPASGKKACVRLSERRKERVKHGLRDPTSSIVNTYKIRRESRMEIPSMPSSVPHLRASFIFISVSIPILLDSAPHRASSRESAHERQSRETTPTQTQKYIEDVREEE